MRDWTAIAGPSAFDQGGFAVERRKTAEAALEQAHDELRDVSADSLGSVDNAGSGGRCAERVEELATLHLIEAVLQRFRELGREAPCYITPHLSVSASGVRSRLLARRPAQRKG
jgi:hypothetical protein